MSKGQSKVLLALLLLSVVALAVYFMASRAGKPPFSNDTEKEFYEHELGAGGLAQHKDVIDAASRFLVESQLGVSGPSIVHSKKAVKHDPFTRSCIVMFMLNYSVDGDSHE